MNESNNKNKIQSNEKIKKGDVDCSIDDLEIIIDSSKIKEDKMKHYGSKLVDTGICPTNV